LALLPAGTFNDRGGYEPYTDPEHFASAAIGYLKLPVTSVKGWGAFVKQTSAVLKRPPHGVVARIKVVPDANTQFKVVFEHLAEVPKSMLGAIMKRNVETKAVIDFPYPLTV